MKRSKIVKKHIITIAGDLASGKRRITYLLQKNLNYEIYRNGEYVRKLAKEKGLNITKFNEGKWKYNFIRCQKQKRILRRSLVRCCKYSIM